MALYREVWCIDELGRVIWRDAPFSDATEEGIVEGTLDVDSKSRQLAVFDIYGEEWSMPFAGVWHREVRDAETGLPISRAWHGMVGDHFHGEFETEKGAEAWVMYAFETWALAAHARYQAEESRRSISDIDEAIETLKSIRALVTDSVDPVKRITGCLEAVEKAREAIRDQQEES